MGMASEASAIVFKFFGYPVRQTEFAKRFSIVIERNSVFVASMRFALGVTASIALGAWACPPYVRIVPSILGLVD
nr:hypothetical protein [Brucella intermedia]